MPISTEVISFVVRLFCLSTMFVMGLSASLDDVLQPFRNKLALAIIVLVNNVVLPLVGLVIISIPSALHGTPLQAVAEAIIPLTSVQKTGFLLALMASGTLLGPIFAEVAGLSGVLARGIMVTSAGATAVSMPLVLMLVRPVTGTSLEPGPVFLTLLTYQLLPLALGVFLRQKYEEIAKRVRPVFMQLTALSFLLMTAMVLVSNLAPLDFNGVLPVETVDKGSIVVQGDVDEDTIAAALSPEMQQTYVGVSPVVEQITQTGWIVVDPGVTYYARYVTSTLIVSNASDLARTIPLDDGETVQGQLDALTDGQIPLRLRGDLTANGIDLPVRAQSAQLLDGRWILTNADTTYFVALESLEEGQSTLAIHQEIPSPTAFANQLMTALTSLPAVKPLLAVLGDVVVVLIPYAVFAAIVALLLTVGAATGSIINNMVESGLPDPPRVVAVSTSVRNVSAVLIVAAEHLSLQDGTLGFVLLFYVISLIVVGVRVNGWKSGASAAEAEVQMTTAPVHV